MDTVEKLSPKGLIRHRRQQIQTYSLKLTPEFVLGNLSSLKKMAIAVFERENKNTVDYRGFKKIAARVLERTVDPNLKKIAVGLLERENEGPADYASVIRAHEKDKSSKITPAVLAAYLLRDVDEMERRWRQLGIDQGLALVDAGIQLAGSYADLVVSCGEPETYVGMKNLPALERGRAASANKRAGSTARESAKCKEIAQALLKGNQTLGKSKDRLAERVRAKLVEQAKMVKAKSGVDVKVRARRTIRRYLKKVGHEC
jgi:hypothetical protein